MFRPTFFQAQVVFCRLLVATLVLLNPSALYAKSVTTEVTGADELLRDNILAHAGLNNLPCDLPELQLRSKLRSFDKTMSTATRALGYYHARWQVELAQKPANGDKSCWHIRIDITPAEPVLIDKVDVQINGEGTSDPVFTRFLNNLPVSQGDQLNHARYEEIKTGLRERARNHGYPEGAFKTQSLKVDLTARQATVTLHFNSGPRYQFGAVSFNTTPLDEELLRRYMPFQEGSPFSTRDLIQFQNNLINSNYFDSVDVEQEAPQPDIHTIPITVRLTVKSPYETSVGLGYSTDIGPRLSYELRNRRINPQGDTYILSSQVSPVASNIGFTLQQPGENPIREKTLWSAGWQMEETDSSKSSSYETEYATLTLLDNRWLQKLGLRYLFEKFDIADDSETTMLLMPGITLSRTVSDDSRYPRRGWRLVGTLRGAVKGVVSDLSMAQMELDGKVILPFLGGRLLSRAGIAATAIDDFVDMPASLRYFAGGDNSIRGWAYQTLGPENSDGDVVGGKHRVSTSVEVDYPIWKDYSAALFYDAGTAFDTDQFTLYESVGFGARWFSPIGPIRIDFAFPLDDGGFRLHFSMGPDL